MGKIFFCVTKVLKSGRNIYPLTRLVCISFLFLVLANPNSEAEIHYRFVPTYLAVPYSCQIKPRLNCWQSSLFILIRGPLHKTYNFGKVGLYKKQTIIRETDSKNMTRSDMTVITLISTHLFHNHIL